MWSVSLNLQPTCCKMHKIPLICCFWNRILSADRIFRHWHSIQTGTAVMSLHRCTHVIMNCSPPVLSFTCSLFFQHQVSLTLLLRGVQSRNSELTPGFTVGFVIKAMVWQLLSFSEGWFERSDTHWTPKPGTWQNLRSRVNLLPHPTGQ